MGSKGQSQQASATNSNQTYTANPQIAAAGTQALNQAQSAAAQPFQMPVAPVAGLNATQNQAFNQYQGLQGIQTPFYNQAASLYGQAGSRPDVASYYNPMAANVTAQMQNIFGQQDQQNTSNLVQSAGGIGADRIAVGQGNLANQQGLAAGQTYAGLWNQAAQEAQAQQQAQAGAAAGWANLGNMSLQSGLQGTGALLQSGNQVQAQTQAQLNAPYQNQLASLAYPFQTAQYLSGITGGLAPAFGGTTTGVQNQNTTSTPAQPSIFSQILGAGTAGVGLAGGLGAFNGSPSYGGGSIFSGDAYGGSGSNPLPGLSPSDYGAGYAPGGAVDDESSGEINLTSPTNNLDPIVPNVPLHGGAGHSGPLTGGINFPQPPSPSQQGSGDNIGGDIAKLASTVLPFLLKKGGKVPTYGDGGGDTNYSDPLDVPWGMNSRFYGEHNSHTDPAPDPGPPTTGPKLPFVQQGVEGSFADQVAKYLGNGTADATTQAAKPFGPQPPIPYPNSGDVAVPPPRFMPSGQPPMAPPPPKRVISSPSPAAVAPGLPARQQPITQEGTQGLPYPDSLKRDWGQDATRSPWMSLVAAGATMMSTPGPLGVSIGKGLMAGTKSLDDQRKELRSEQEINDKAAELAEKAKEHLDKYNKMTPYERGTLALKSKELDQSAENGGVDAKTQRFLATQARMYYSQLSRANDQELNPLNKKTPEQLQEMAIQLARRTMGLGASAPQAGSVPGGAANPVSSAPVAGSSPATALPDPGDGKRTPGTFYIGPTGKPQQWGG